MTEHTIIADVVGREGGFRVRVQRPNGTWDPDTMYGITAPVLGRWRGLGRDATAGELRTMTRDEAADIYRVQYIDEPGFSAANIPYEPLRIQLIDFGVNSGQATAVRWLQRVLGMTTTQVDGVLGPKTVERLRFLGGEWTGFDTTHYRLVNDALVAARSYMIDRAVDQGIMRKMDEEGVESRALSFFLARP